MCGFGLAVGQGSLAQFFQDLIDLVGGIIVVQDVIAAGVPEFLEISKIIFICNSDDHAGEFPFAQEADGRNAVHARHFHVHKQKVIWRLQGFLDYFVDGVDVFDSDSIFLQLRGNLIDHGFVFFDEQTADRDGLFAVIAGHDFLIKLDYHLMNLAGDVFAGGDLGEVFFPFFVSCT